MHLVCTFINKALLSVMNPQLRKEIAKKCMFHHRFKQK